MSCWKDPNALEKGRSALIKRWKKKTQQTNREREEKKKEREEREIRYGSSNTPPASEAYKCMLRAGPRH